jgi:proteasome lid subunit RPN8/RPN11
MNDNEKLTELSKQLEQVIALNARTELLHSQDSGCTAAACLAEVTIDGRTLLGQNWDWRPACRDSALLLHIHQHAKEAYPEECAGAIVGMDVGEMKIVVDVWRAENVHEDERSRRFLIEPLKIKEFEERASERDMDVLGFYHSHPDHPAEPSEYDREHAWPYYSYVIASVSAENVEEMRSWVLKDDRSGYDEEPVLG